MRNVALKKLTIQFHTAENNTIKNRIILFVIYSWDLFGEIKLHPVKLMFTLIFSSWTNCSSCGTQSMRLSTRVSSIIFKFLNFPAT